MIEDEKKKEKISDAAPSTEDLANSSKSEEVRDIIERMPTRWTAWTALVVAVLMGAVIALSFLIKYPDTVDGQVSITASIAPVRLVSGSVGRIHLLLPDRTAVCAGAVIAHIDNGADYASVRRVDTLLRQNFDSNTELTLPAGDLLLGDLSNTYNRFALAYEQYDQLRNSRLYANMRKNLCEQMAADERVVDNLAEELRLKRQVVANLKGRLAKDSLLMGRGGLSEADYHGQYNNYLSQEEGNVNLQSSRLSKLSNISQRRLELARVDIEEAEALQKAYLNAAAARNELSAALLQWKERYLLTAPVGGEVEYLGFWRENTFVKSAQELFTILPAKNDILGEVYIPSQGAGKVKVGQEANVKLNDFPYDEYGMMKGRVRSVARLTNKLTTTEGTTETYLVVVEFPHGLTTNFGRHLSLNFETKGTIEIITKPKRLIERLFDNLKAQGSK